MTRLSAESILSFKANNYESQAVSTPIFGTWGEGVHAMMIMYPVHILRNQGAFPSEMPRDDRPAAVHLWESSG